MKFRLTYDGELRATQNKKSEERSKSLSDHKMDIRRHFHWQLKAYWNGSSFLKDYSLNPSDIRRQRNASDYLPRDEDPYLSTPEDQKIGLEDYLAIKHAAFGYEFVPLVTKEWEVHCSLSILLLRNDYPGKVVHAGDIDNRVKTIIDCLRIPKHMHEIGYKYRDPKEKENRLFALMEDDDLVSNLFVETDLLLFQDRSSGSHDQRVKAIISVSIQPYRITMDNLSFL